METKSDANQSPLKVVVIGPESTGKSTLCTGLALHYKTSWCPEFARDYLLKHGVNYNYENLLTIAKGQLALEDYYINQVQTNNLSRSKDIIFIDTDMYVMKVWCEFVFKQCHLWILDQITKRKYDLYLLCNIDLPWQKDELREYPDLETRTKLFHIYKDIMINQHVPWVLISGDYEERLDTAIRAVDHLLGEGSPLEIHKPNQ